MAWHDPRTWIRGEVVEVEGLGVCELVDLTDHQGTVQFIFEDVAGQQYAMAASTVVRANRTSEPPARLFRELREARRQIHGTAGRPSRALDVWAAVLPARVVNEDLGDYLEDIHQRVAAGQTWCVYLRVGAAIFWTAVNAIGYAMKALGKKKAS